MTHRDNRTCEAEAEKMTSLPEALPNVDQLLSLEPEELGGALLPVYVTEQSNRDCFQPSAPVQWAFHHEPYPYPASCRSEILIAVMEAAAWLEAAGLIMDAPTQASSFKTLTRRGRRFANAETFAEFRRASQLPRQLLHTRIADNAYLNFARGKYDTAVFEAFKEVEIAVRDASGLTGLLGVPLMRKAFAKDDGPLTDPDQDGGERQGVMDLFAGAIASYKNPHSHRRVELDAADAVEMIMLASHLLRIVDARRPRHGI